MCSYDLNNGSTINYIILIWRWSNRAEIHFRCIIWHHSRTETVHSLFVPTLSQWAAATSTWLSVSLSIDASPREPIGRAECDVILGSRKHGCFKQREQCLNLTAAETGLPMPTTSARVTYEPRGRWRMGQKQPFGGINRGSLNPGELRRKADTAQSRVCVPAALIQPRTFPINRKFPNIAVKMR